jgi:hypothetical protein
VRGFDEINGLIPFQNENDVCKRLLFRLLGVKKPRLSSG